MSVVREMARKPLEGRGFSNLVTLLSGEHGIHWEFSKCSQSQGGEQFISQTAFSMCLIIRALSCVHTLFYIQCLFMNQTHFILCLETTEFQIPFYGWVLLLSVSVQILSKIQGPLDIHESLNNMKCKPRSVFVRKQYSGYSTRWGQTHF